MRQKIFRVVKQTVHQAHTNQGTGEHKPQQPIKFRRITTVLPVDPLHEMVANQESAREKQPIPTQSQRTKRRQHWIDVPDHKFQLLINNYVNREARRASIAAELLLLSSNLTDDTHLDSHCGYN
jgi:hypothetical protein